LLTVHQAAVCDGLAFDPFPFDQNGLGLPEVDVGVHDAEVAARDKQTLAEKAITEERAQLVPLLPIYIAIALY
jgi:hypothetical protein